MLTKIGMISLGCPKNQVDFERMASALESAGFTVVDDLGDAQIIIVNTCCFIEDAKKESIANILDAASMKEDGLVKRLVITGCMAERYRDELHGEFPEADAVIGIGANGDIVDVVTRLAGEDGEPEFYSCFPEKTLLPLDGKRRLASPPYWAYLRLADGCSNRCSYCAIPSIRGRFRSRPMSNIVTEAKELVAGGAKELILIAQDTTRYGEDIYGDRMLPRLLDELQKIQDLRWIRLLYCYTDRITDELISAMERNDKVLRYIDIPIQHCNADILKAMNRSGDRGRMTALINKLRERLPGIVIRTSLIAGFPGETAEQFEELCDFVREMKFDRLGCFAYSREEGTPAAELEGQLDDDVRASRAETVMDIQEEIFLDKLRASVGSVLPVMIDFYDSYTDSYYGRASTDAPEIDGIIHVTCGYELEEGDIVDVEVTNVVDGELIGEVC